MDQFSFQGPYAYRWVDHVPVERIDLRSGVRQLLRLGERLGAPATPPQCHKEPTARLRAAMASWN